jgi:hypothetical protein
VVGFDSIILPGREGKVTQEVDLSNFHGGNFKKTITVISDASNEPSLKLSLSGNVMAYIRVNAQYIRMQCEAGKENTAEIVLGSQKKDLKISDVTFEAGAGDNRHGQPAGGAMDQWQVSLPQPLTFKVKPSEKPDGDGYYDYTITVSRKDAPEKTSGGEFSFRTNHPSKKEIKIRGIIEASSRKEQ